MDIASISSPIDLCTPVLKPRVRHFDHRDLSFLEPKVTILWQGVEPTLTLAANLVSAVHLQLQLTVIMLMLNFTSKKQDSNHSTNCSYQKNRISNSLKGLLVQQNAEQDFFLGDEMLLSWTENTVNSDSYGYNYPLWIWGYTMETFLTSIIIVIATFQWMAPTCHWKQPCP